MIENSPSRQIILSPDDRNIWVYIATSACAVLVFYLKFSFKVLDVNYYDWLTSFGDTTTEYLSWQFFRNTPWTFPAIGTMSGYFYPTVTGVGLTGAIPAVAVPLKLISPWLSPDFQYFGWWYLLCYLLQGYFSIRLLKALGLGSSVYLFLGSLFFLLSPSLLYRSGHMNLCAHWLILWALVNFYSSDSVKQKIRIQWFLVFLTAAVHQYLLLMVLGLNFATLWKSLRSDERLRGVSGVAIFAFNAANLLTVAVVWFLLGNFNTRLDVMTGSGLGYFSANLNTFINSMGRCRLPGLKTGTEGQFEGFAYLGAGLLIAAFSCAIYWIISYGRKSLADRRAAAVPQQIADGVRLNAAIWIICLLFAFFAFSDVVYWNDAVVLSYKSWVKIYAYSYIAEAFRSSGRFIWPLQYLLTAQIILWFWRIDIKRYLNAALFSLLTAIQTYDVYPAILCDRPYLKLNGAAKPITLNVWKEITKEADRIVSYPPYEWTYKEYLDYGWFAKVASLNKKAITTGYLARPDMSVIMGYADTLNARLAKGELGDEARSIFIVQKKMMHIFEPLRKKGLVKEFMYEGYGVVVPLRLEKTIAFMETLDKAAPFDQDLIGFKDFLIEHENEVVVMVSKGPVQKGLCWELTDYMQKMGSRIDTLPKEGLYTGMLYHKKLLIEKISADPALTVRIAAGSVLNGFLVPAPIELKAVSVATDKNAAIKIGNQAIDLRGPGMHALVFNEQLELQEQTTFNTNEVCWSVRQKMAAGRAGDILK